MQKKKEKKEEKKRKRKHGALITSVQGSRKLKQRYLHSNTTKSKNTRPGRHVCGS
jgi:hypothetical protein